MKTMKMRFVGLLLATLLLLSAVPMMFIVSAADEDPLTVNYENETITVTGADAGDITYMYALKLKDTSDTSIAKAKWFPLYGKDLDISRYIPKKADAKFIIAVKEIKTGKVETIEIKGRPDAKALKGKVTYDIEAEAFKNEADTAVQVSLGDSTEIIELDKKGEEDATKPVALDYFPAGAAFTYRVSETEKTFASALVKGKVKAQPKAPKLVLADQTAKRDNPAYSYIKGASDKIEVLVGTKKVEDNTVGAWVKIPTDKKNISIADLKKLMKDELAKLDGYTSEAKEVKEGEKVVSHEITFRTAAVTGKKPASAKIVVEIPDDKYKAPTPTAKFADAEIKTATTTTVKVTLTNGTFKEVAVAKVDDLFEGLTADDGIEYALNAAVGAGDKEATIKITTTDDDAISLTLNAIKIKTGMVTDEDGNDTTSVIAVTGTIKIDVPKED